jgi:hypothetical protein
MKTCPDLTFVQVDVTAAVDVMYLINKLSTTTTPDGSGTIAPYKREDLDLFDPDDVARGMIGGLDFDDEDDDDDEWDENDVDGIDFFKT